MATGDLTITWTRRARGFNEWTDAVDVPLVEFAESYIVQIFGDDGLAVVRTIAAATESAVYTAAQQAADFSGAYALPVDGLAEITRWTGATGWGFVIASTAWQSVGAGTLYRDVPLIGEARLDVIDGGAATATFSVETRNVSGTATLALGFEWLASNGRSLGIVDATPAALGATLVTVSHTATIPAHTRTIRLRVTSGGADVRLEPPFAISLSASARPVKARVRQLGAGNIEGFGLEAAL